MTNILEALKQEPPVPCFQTIMIHPVLTDNGHT